MSSGPTAYWIYATPSSTITEPGTGLTFASFTVQFSDPNFFGGTINYTVSGAADAARGYSAASAADFGGVFPTGTITFASTHPYGPGAPPQTITIPVSPDNLAEGPQGFAVTLWKEGTNPAETVIPTPTAFGVILDNQTFGGGNDSYTSTSPLDVLDGGAGNDTLTADYRNAPATARETGVTIVESASGGFTTSLSGASGQGAVINFETVAFIGSSGVDRLQLRAVTPDVSFSGTVGLGFGDELDAIDLDWSHQGAATVNLTRQNGFATTDGLSATWTEAASTVRLGSGNDEVRLGSGAGISQTGAFGGPIVYTGAGADTINVENAYSASIYTGADADDITLDGVNGSFAVFAETGNDIVTVLQQFGYFGTIDGGEGDDTLDLTNASINAPTSPLYIGDNGSYYLTDLSGEGEVYIKGFEVIKFADRTVDLRTNAAPTFTSPSALSVTSQTSSVSQIVAQDPDGDSRWYEIAGGDDSALFKINSQTGQLSFIAAPDYNAPNDQGGDNTYKVTIRASDPWGHSTSQALTVTVTPASSSTAGGPGDDSLTGTGAGETLKGLGGADTLRAGGGNDLAYGGAGADTAFGEGGDDELHGGSGDDVLDGGTGIDILYGEDGSDRLDGGDSADRLFGQTGADSLYGGGGGDLLTGGEGRDQLDGQAGNDTLFGETENDVLNGGSGQDRLYGEGGADTLNGGAEADKVYGGDGADQLSGEGDEDYLYGEAGNDLIAGGAGTDHLYGQQGDDSLSGDDGNDFLFGGEGHDALRGGAGYDVFYFADGADAANSDTIIGFARGEDRIGLSAATFGSGAVSVGAAPTDDDSQLLFNPNTHQLIWFAEGAAGSGSLLATLSGVNTFSSSDVLVL